MHFYFRAARGKEFFAADEVIMNSIGASDKLVRVNAQNSDRICFYCDGCIPLRLLGPCCQEALRSSRLRRTPWFIPSLDHLTNGGLEIGRGLTEVYGPPGAGKTLLCLHVCASFLVGAKSNFPQDYTTSHNSPIYKGGRISEQRVIFVDTEGGFVSQRFLDVAQTLLRSFDASCRAEYGTPENLLDRLDVLRVFDALDLKKIIEKILELQSNCKVPDTGASSRTVNRSVTNIQDSMPSHVLKALGRCRMLVVDSFGYLFNPAFYESSLSATAQLLEVVRLLKQLACEAGVLVILTNQTQFMAHPVDGAATNQWSRMDTIPYVTRAWSHAAYVRLQCKPLPTKHTTFPNGLHLIELRMTKSTDPRYKDRSVIVQVTRQGLRDITISL